MAPRWMPWGRSMSAISSSWMSLRPSRGNGVFSFAIDSSSSNGVMYGSRESSNGAPELIITQAPTDEVSVNLPPPVGTGPIVMSDTIFANETTELVVSASDPDGDRLTYMWSMEFPAGFHFRQRRRGHFCTTQRQHRRKLQRKRDGE